MAPDFGRDLHALPKLQFRSHDGYSNLAEALARRLMTPRGALHYDSQYGTDIRRFINASGNDISDFALAELVRRELEQDERVISAEAEIERVDLVSMTIVVAVRTASGPFSLTLRADEFAVILEGT
jgi:hypothetical protein